MHRVPVGVEAQESCTLPYIVRSYMARNNVISSSYSMLDYTHLDLSLHMHVYV